MCGGRVALRQSCHLSSRAVVMGAVTTTIDNQACGGRVGFQTIMSVTTRCPRLPIVQLFALFVLVLSLDRVSGHMESVAAFPLMASHGLTRCQC